MNLNEKIMELRDADKNLRVRAALALGSHGDSRALQALLERFSEEPDFFVRENLTWAVVRIGEAAMRPLLELLSSTSVAARQQAAQTLGKLASRESVNALIVALHDPEPEVIKRAAQSLGQIGDLRAIPALLRFLSSEDAALGSTISTALEEFGVDAVEPLTNFLRLEPSWLSRQRVVDILGAVGHSAAIPGLQRALEDRQWQVRFAAVTALSVMKAPSAMEAIRAVVSDADSRVRILAARVVG